MKKNQGFTLIELLIAMILGLFISAVLLRVLIGNGFSMIFNEGLSKTQENGRFMLQLFARELRLAGYRSNVMSEKIDPFYMGSCAHHTICTFNHSGIDDDQISIQYDPPNQMDCANNILNKDELTANTYYLDLDTSNNNIKSLFCQSYDPSTGQARGNPVMLVHGVDSLKIVYGVLDKSLNHIEGYYRANDISDWKKVKNARVSFLVNSGMDIPGLNQSNSKIFNLLKSGNQVFSDGHPRLHYEINVILNNAGI